jgi:chemotaxis protein MotB
MARKKKHEEHENLERWLISYSDFITLLFALFVVLFALTNIDLKKLKQASKSIQFGFAVMGTGGTGAPPVFHGPEGDSLTKGEYKGKIVNYERLMEVKKRLIHELFEFFEEGKGKGGLELKLDDRGLVIRISGEFIKKGDAALEPPVASLLNKISPELKTLNFIIRVEGHTNSDFVPGDLYSSGWELSSKRAANVANYLIEKEGFAPDKVLALGYADHRPIMDTSTGKISKKNERIDVVIIGRGEAKG